MSTVTDEEMTPVPSTVHREVSIDANVIPKEPSSQSILEAKRRQFVPQQSTVAARRQHAVCVRRAHKSYGPKSNKNIILDGLNMTVPIGCM